MSDAILMFPKRDRAEMMEFLACLSCGYAVGLRQYNNFVYRLFQIVNSFSQIFRFVLGVLPEDEMSRYIDNSKYVLIGRRAQAVPLSL